MAEEDASNEGGAEGGAEAQGNDDPLIAAAKERIADLLEPINGGVGEDISYDEKFDEIKNETEKLSSLTGETCNWAAIGVTAEEILQDKSKDFRIACYLSACKLREGNLDGVIDGLVLLQEMTAKYWDDMFPPVRRMRARAGMVGWMSEQAGPVMIDYKLSASDNPKVKVIDDLSKALDADFRERFGEHYPGISHLRDAVRHWLRTIPKEKKPEPKPEPKAEAPSGGAAAPARPAPAPAPAGGGGGGGGIEVTTPEEAQRALTPLGQLMRRIAAQLRAGKPENPLAYRLLRLGAWMELETAPPAPNENKTMVPPPPPHVTGALESLAGSNDWLNLLNAAELHAGNYILWLDPHRYAATAMSALGALFMKAKDELLLQVALVLKRVPNLPTLAFSDGTPFADGATQMWIEAEVLPVLASGEGGGGGADTSALGEALKEARDLAVKGELGKALDAVALATASAGTPVDRFRGQLASAQLCLGAGQHAIARSQLEGLTQQIEAHQLTSWDPAICAEVYGGLYSAIKSLNDDKRPKNPQQAAQMAQQGAPAVSPEDEAAEKAAFEMLCRLDPARALKLGGSK
ncbi:MAG TPA: type VI secretion system protein TssA [Polyangiaceae bacterium]|nr:type VI secretion system protein TssA [Polyangiaceae bacterium]